MWKRLLLPLALLLAVCRHESTLPRLFPVPAETLVADSGKQVSLGEMKGYVTVYDFIFTNCGGSCPLMTATMRRLTKKIDKAAKVRFVSISVDPARDTPAVLADYARRVRNDERWLFLTGGHDQIIRLSVDASSSPPAATPSPAPSRCCIAPSSSWPTRTAPSASTTAPPTATPPSTSPPR